MRRREFFTLVGGAAAWPLAVHAQQAAKAPVIGFLGSGTVSSGNQWVAAFVQRLRELGWIEGQTVTIEYRWAEGRSERFAEFAAEFVGTSTSFSRITPRRSLPQSKQHQLSQSCLQQRPTQLIPA